MIYKAFGFKTENYLRLESLESFKNQKDKICANERLIQLTNLPCKVLLRT